MGHTENLPLGNPLNAAINYLGGLGYRPTLLNTYNITYANQDTALSIHMANRMTYTLAYYVNGEHKYEAHFRTPLDAAKALDFAVKFGLDQP